MSKVFVILPDGTKEQRDIDYVVHDVDAIFQRGKQLLQGKVTRIFPVLKEGEVISWDIQGNCRIFRESNSNEY